MATTTRILLFGAAGRMGEAIMRLAGAEGRAHIAAAIVRSGSPSAGLACAFAPGSSYLQALPTDVVGDGVLDVTGANGFDDALAAACARGIGFVSGSTGLSTTQLAALDAASRRIPVLLAANFSLGIAVLTRLVAQAARSLPDWDVEIVEAHHRLKRDAPSGTALLLGDAVGQGRQAALPVAGPARCGPRGKGELGYAVIRAGDIVGEHSVWLAGDGERIELAHRATSRDVFARGALVAAAWIAGRTPGRYAMDDVLDV
ncbi:MAG: 4-hydroxy-tetrahydrodipicolinate reductase [Dokdonella sp.]|nr:4-hydroxy-tetrahydrodipicolinate reductase [Dokdonella sp.]